MLVVSNTSPISNLAIIGRLELLRRQFHEIQIPGPVHLELGRLSDRAAQNEIQKAIRECWIKPWTLRENNLTRLLAATLDPGEVAAIALALELTADLILLDERDGRTTAQRSGLRVTGVLGVLLRAKKQSQIELIKPEIEALRTRARFFLTTRLEQQVLDIAGE